MYGITDLWTYVLGVIFIVLLPGPNSLFVLSVAVQRGVKAGYLAACGIFVGDTILMFLSAAGVASVLKANPALFLVVKYAGAIYLAWIGVQLLMGAAKNFRAQNGSVGPIEKPKKIELNQLFRKSLVISLLNPKAIMFLISFFIQFVDPVYPHPALTFLILGSIIQITSFIYLSTLIIAGAKLAETFSRRKKLSASLAATVGAMFIGFGAKLATTTLG